MSKTILNLVRQKFGMLTFISREGLSPIGYFKCDCGEFVYKNIAHAKRNKFTSSCGCFLKKYCKERESTHGMSKQSEFTSWQAMLDRCYNKNNVSYKRYGGRGIKVCKRWRYSFENFFSDMGLKPTPKHSLDRYPNNDGNYEPSNCRWATRKEQQRNRSNTPFLEYNGQRLTLQEWADILNIPKYTLLRKLKKQDFIIIIKEFHVTQFQAETILSLN